MKDEVFRHLVEHHGFRFFVLESGFAEGVLVDDWINRLEVAKRTVCAYFYQFFEAGFFHADPHPGNIFV